MYIATLVDDVRKIIEDLGRKHGPLVLAMLYRRDEMDTGWNLIIAAPWTDSMGITKATRALTEALSAGLAGENKHSISRVTVLPTNDEFVREITSIYPAASPASVIPVNNISISRVPIGSGLILYSRAA